MTDPDPRHLVWRTSSHSGHNGKCVAVAAVGDGRVAVRDTKDPAGPVLVFGPEVWVAFLRAVREDMRG
jgi:hypothetical protein